MTGQPADLGRRWYRNIRLTKKRRIGTPGQRSPRKVPPAERILRQPGTHPKRSVNEGKEGKKRKLKPGKPSSGWTEKGGKRKTDDPTWEKLLDQAWKEKYSLECPELREHHKKHINLEQMESINLDDHLAYLTQIRQDLSQYPHWNVMSCRQLLKQLEDHDMSMKADWVRTVIEKGLNSYAPARKLPANAPVIKPQIQCYSVAQ